MNEDYRNAMSRIKADDEFKARLLERLEAEQHKLNTPKAKKPFPFKRYIPALSGVAAAAVLTLAVFASKNFILPLIAPELDPEQAYLGSLSENKHIEKENADGTVQPDVNEDYVVQGVVPDADSSASSVSDIAEPGETAPPVTEAPPPVEKVTAYTDTNSMDAVDSTESQYRISFSTAHDVPIKGLSSASETIDYNMTLHFTFEGFDEYGIALQKSDIIFCKSLPKNYTVADLLCDHYNIIIGDMGNIEMYNGLLEIFLDIRASNSQPIDVYADGIEILNLDTQLMSEFKDSEDVYFVISAT